MCLCVWRHAHAYDCNICHPHRSVLGLDKEPDLVHLEAHTPDGSKCTQPKFPLKSNN